MAHFPGNLALSRALGDFAFKRNSKKPAEEQIVTGGPYYISLLPFKYCETLVHFLFISGYLQSVHKQ